MEGAIFLKYHILLKLIPQIYGRQKWKNILEITLIKQTKNYIEEIVDKFAEYSATDLTFITYNQSPRKEVYVPLTVKIGNAVFQG